MKELFDRFRRSGYAPLAVMAAASVIAVALLYSQYKRMDSELDRGYTEGKVLAARHSAMRVQQFLEAERDNLAGFAAALSLVGDSTRGKALAESQFASGARKRKLFNFFVMDDGGRFMYSAPESLIDRRMQDLSDKKYFIAPVRTKGFFIGSAQPDNRDGWEVVLSMPVYAGNDGAGQGRLLGVAAERVDVCAFEDVLTDGQERVSGGYPILVDDSGRVLAGGGSGMLYQVENSSPVLQKMIGGEEGSLRMDVGGDGPLVAAFSPVRFEGRVWSAGIIYPAGDVAAGARSGFSTALPTFGLLALAFAWGAVSLARTGRGRRRASELSRLEESVAERTRYIGTLSDLTKAMGAGEDADGVLRGAVAIIKADVGASGAAVRMLQPSGGGLMLAAELGMPAAFAAGDPCPDQADCRCMRVMEGGVPVFIDEEAQTPEVRMACGCCSKGGVALVPLAVNGRNAGMLYVAGPRDGLTPERTKFLEAAGGHIATWHANLMRIEDANRNAAMATALFNTAQALTRSLDLDELLRIIMSEASSLLKVGRCILLLYNEERNLVDCRMALGFDCRGGDQTSFSPSGVFWEAIEDGGVKVVDQRERKQEVPAGFVERFGMSSFILVTLTSKGRVLGFLVLDMGGRGRAVPDELKLIMGFANQAAIAIETSSYYIRTVEKYNEDLQRLSVRIIEAQEEERKRISLDLHDELGQILTAVRINLDLVAERYNSDPKQALERLTDSISLTGSALDSVRRLSFELRPPMLDDLGLGSVLGKLITDFRERSGMEVEFTLEGPDDRLPPDVELALYRVVQEALTNVIRHAKATRVSVRLDRDPVKGVAGLYVEDDGEGFEPGRGFADGHGGGFGLMGIKERVALLGGNFRIFSEPGKGARLLVDIPWNKGDR